MFLAATTTLWIWGEGAVEAWCLHGTEAYVYIQVSLGYSDVDPSLFFQIRIQPDS